MITYKYSGPTLVKIKFWDDSVCRFIERGTIIKVRYVRVGLHETTVFFALFDEDIGHFAVFYNHSSDTLSDIFNRILKNLVN